MKILKKGKLPEDKEYRFSCPNCRSVLEALWKEGTVHDNQRDGAYIQFQCPVCYHKVSVDI